VIIINLFFYILAFILIWVGSGFIVSSTSRFSEKLKLSAFAFSFIFLGLFTSIPELSVGLQSVADNEPEIFVGNLIGGIAVIFLLIIPLLAVFGRGINLKNELDDNATLLTLAVVSLPSFFVLDKRVTNLEGMFMIISYVLLLILVGRRHGIFDRGNKKLLNTKSYSYKDLLKIIFGIVLVFISSAVIVDKTNYFAQAFSIPEFYLGLIIISLGTNLPELSIAIRSVISGKKDIAMGDYLGSAAANTLLFGLFTLMIDGEVVTVDNFLVTFIFILFALCVFYLLYSNKKIISRKNGILMLGIYALFIVVEILGSH
jgi:cation:H+ antiporter